MIKSLDSIQSQSWQRRSTSLLTNSPPSQNWCSSGFYSPRVINAQGKFRMWFDGSELPRIDYVDHCIGYAESSDGINWTLFDGNPVVRPQDMPWEATMLSTPWVIYDEDEQQYKMWCGTGGPIARRERSGYAVQSHEKLAYGTSPDGLTWTFHPKPLAEGIRAPCVHKVPDGYRMWINDRANFSDSYMVAYAHIYEYGSKDGIHWKRREPHLIAAEGITKTCVYPCVLKVEDRWFMWHKSHLAEHRKPLSQPFEIFCNVSDDGIHWKACHNQPAFAAADDPERFDWKAVSTPCVIRKGDELWMYYAAQNFKRSFNRFEGSTDGIGMHFGLATLKVEDLLKS